MSLRRIRTPAVNVALIFEPKILQLRPWAFSTRQLASSSLILEEGFKLIGGDAS